MNDFGEPRGFQRDGGNYEKNWLRHGVTNAEAEQIFSNSALVIAEPESQIWGELRYYAYGQLTKTVSYLWCLPFAENFSALFLPETWVGGNVEIMTTLKKQIPKFDSEDEEREFWANHDSADYIDWSEAKRVGMPNLKPSSQPS